MSSKSIVETIYEANPEISDAELAKEILNYPNLELIDFWLLPQYPFNVWRRKYDYPRLLKNIKENQADFTAWMKSQSLDDADLLGGFLSDFFEHKVKSKNKLKYLIEVSYKGKINLQSWDNYNGKTSSEGNGEQVVYKYIKSYISYYDWKQQRGQVFSFRDEFDTTNPNTKDENVYLNLNTRLIKMGGIHPPINGFGAMCRGKNLEFVNVSGLKLNGKIYYGTLGNLRFNHCSVDNLVCNELDLPHLDFKNCNVRNLQVRNSDLSQWGFYWSYVTGNIIDSKIGASRIYGGLFSPTFTNCEISKIDVQHKEFTHDYNFEKTYRTIAKASKESGASEQYRLMKICEYDFIKSKKKGLKKLLMNIDKYYWGYGIKPYRLVYISLISIFMFGFLYSLFPSNFKGMALVGQPYWKVLYNSIYYSIVTFTTLGYGDLSPNGFLKLFAGLEAIFGALTTGFLVAGLSKSH